MAKAVAFTVIFWVVWLFALRPLWYGSSDESSKASQAADVALRQQSQDQAQRAARLQDEYERQFKRSDEQLKRQAELQERWEKVIERWEKTAPNKKP